jgi:beta-lactamase regulating signal transducer with metallopeptidase domain/protocatechuate 3,4-dioxygenase beta subunit
LPTWQALVLLAWMAAVILMVVLLIQRVFFVRALLAQSREAPDALSALLEQCRRHMGMHGVAGVRLTSLSASPSVCGLLRPMILMPEPMARQLEMSQLRSVLFHELAHIKRGDLWINLLQTLLQIVYLYHPLLWLANARIRAIREQAVDEAVLAALGEDAEEYPRTLLNISKLAFGRPALSLRLLGVVESKRALTARIRHMVSRPFPKNARLGLLGLAAIAITAAALLPMARGTQRRTREPSPDQSPDSSTIASAGGVTAELLGVRAYPEADKSWWRADGTPATGTDFPEFKEFRTTDPTFNDPNARVRALALRLAGPSLRDVTVSWSLTNSEGSHSTPYFPMYYVDQADEKEVLRPVQTIVARFVNDAATTDLKFGIAAGPWKDAAAGSEGRTTTHAKDNITQSDVIYHPVQEKSGSLVITATHLLGVDYDCRIVAEDENHRVFEPLRTNNSGGKMRLCISVLKVPRDQVKWFRLQARPYEWAEFKNVRLMPESPALNGGESSFAPAAATQAPAGVVVDEQGKPVSGARVLLYFQNSRRGLGNKIVEETRTDAQGRFTLTKPLTYKIDEGTTYTDHFLLFATHPDFALAWQVLTGSAPKKECRLTMTPPMTQAFRVTDREGKPLPKARVWICGAGRDDERNPLMRPSFAIAEDIWGTPNATDRVWEPGLLTATTDDQGRATVTNLPRTDCSFCASLPGYSDHFRFASTPFPGEAGIQMTRAGTATGRVLTKDGKSVAGAQVWFQADWGEWYFDYAVTDETGRFLNDKMVARGGSWVSGGGTGQYKVTLHHRDFAAREATVQFEPGRTEEFNIEAAPGTRLRVQVLEPGTERPLAGARVAGSSAGGRLDGYTDANGVFERCVLNGAASVFFNSPPGGTYVISNHSSGSVRVSANGGVENITLYAPSRLRPLATIKGRLQLPDGSPAGGIRISTTNNMPRYETATFSGRGSAYTRTNLDGSFELADVPRDAEVFLYGATSDHAYILAEVLNPAQVGANDYSPLLVMREGRTASVLLTDASGKPRANMNLTLRPRQWGDYVFRADDRSATTDAEGRLTLNGIVPGLEYFIRDAQANLGQSGWWNLYNENRVLLAAGDVTPVSPPPPATQQARRGSSFPRGATPGVRTGTEWPISQGGNGHRYWVVRVPEGLTWDEANAAAQARGGYLATITSAEENAFVFALMQDAAYWNGPRGPWIGGYQTPGSGLREGWHWVTGEPFVYSPWSPGQPNDAGGADETRLEYGWGATTPTDTWNDQPDWFRDVYSYVVESEPGGPTQVGPAEPVRGSAAQGGNDGEGPQTRRIALEKSSQVQNSALENPKPGEISGVVVDPNGNPIIGAYVTLENRDLTQLPQPQKDSMRTGPVTREAFTQTDSRGRFTFARLNAGVIDLSVRAQGHRTEFLYGVSTGSTDLRFVLAEPRPYRVSGVVVDSRGRPLGDVRVTFTEETISGSGREKDRPPVTVRTDATGAFRFDRLLPPVAGPSIRRFLSARRQGYGVGGTELDTTGGQTSVQIKLAPEEKVSGVVKTEAGAPIPGASVFLYSAWGRSGSFWFAPTRQQLAPQTTTQADGSFTLSQLPTDSDLFLRVRAEGYASGELSHARTGRFGGGAILRGNATITMGNSRDPNTPLTITLQRAVTLHGTVVYEGTGQPAQAIRVATQAQKGGAGSESVTDTRGRFEITGVSPVPCNLLVMLEEPGRYAIPEWTAAAVSFDALQPGETRTSIGLVLTKGGLIRGKVADKAGQPLKGIDIAFYSAARPRSGAACQSVLTGADGTWAYRFPPGEVYIYIRTSISGGTWQRPAYTYNLSAGQTIEGVDFVLSQAVPQRSPYRSRTAATAAGADRAAGLPAGTRASAAKEWPRAEGGNGHFYMAVRMPDAVSWTDANDIAKRLGGYLATITSEAENEFVFRLVDDDTYWYHGINWRGPWMGGYQTPGASEPDGG